MMSQAPEIVGSVVLVVLLAVWALRDRSDHRRVRVEYNHRLRRRALASIDRWEEDRYRHDLRVDVGLAELLNGEVAA